MFIQNYSFIFAVGYGFMTVQRYEKRYKIGIN